MVVCKFFLQGTCKFGDFCKFEHQMPENFSNYQMSTSILRQPHFVNPQQQVKPNPATVDTNTLVKSVVNDMTVAEKGGQWLLSCYAPFKEKPAFPGFEDHSSEEIRLGYYEAVKNGTVDQYKQQVQAMLQQAVMRMKSLQSPSPDIVNLLKSIYNTPPSSYCGVYGTNTTTNSQSSFGNVTNISGTFNQQQQTLTTFQQPSQNIFGKPSQPQTQFGNTSTNTFGAGITPNQIFGGQANNSLFANTQSQTQNTTNNIFRQANSNFPTQSTNSIFGGQPTIVQPNSGSIFGSQPTAGGSVFGAQQPNSSVFGAQQVNSSVFGAQPANTSVFGGQQNASPTYGQVNTGNIFGNSFTNQAASPATTVQSMNQAANIFNNQSQIQTAPKSIFNQSNQQPSVFNQQSTGPVFNQQQNVPAFSHLQNVPAFNQQTAGSVFMQQNPGSVFNQQNVNSPSSSIADAKSHSNSIFGSTENTVIQNPSFSQVQQIDESLYSKLEDLSQEDIKWFESNDLDELKLPENPPTYDMCFKT